jgi:UDP-N-acetylmuramoyl-L-alanyl-D-glutamate--2,6-diaminopimelate ligase
MQRNLKASELVAAFGTLETVCGDAGMVLCGVEYDSRRCGPGSLFVAVKGLVRDGHDFVPQVLAAGAAVVVDRERADEFCACVPGALVISADDTRAALSYISEYFFGQVSRTLPVIGITGTNGKTSTTYMLERIFAACGCTPGVIGTVNYRWKNTVLDAPNTTPESRDLHELMARMAADGVDVIIMEVSSHGLDLGRVDDIRFTVACFSNLTRDHLDYHHDFESYYLAKQKLFDLLAAGGSPDALAVINVDDEYGRRLRDHVRRHSYRVMTIGHGADADLRINDDSVRNTMQGISYVAAGAAGEYSVQLRLAGAFHIYNSLTALAAATGFGLEPGRVIAALGAMDGVPGRFDRLLSPLGFGVVVDYAHTDDAMQKLLSSARGLEPQRLITVFGCGGDRDRTKRPLMGKAAAEWSDLVIVTSDNPRTEDPDKIIGDILPGVQQGNATYRVEPDREKAIALAIGQAAPGDLVIIAGKGHENYQILGSTKIHFDDREIAARYIAERKA